MNSQKVTASVNKMCKSSLPALPYSGRRDNSSRLNRHSHFPGQWMIYLLALCMALVGVAVIITAAPVRADDNLTISVSTGAVGSTVLV